MIINEPEIHPTAKIHPTVIFDGNNIKISKGVVIGAFCVISDDVEIKENAHIHNSVTIGTEAQHSLNNNFSTYKKKIIIGKNTVIREYVTIHKPTESGLTEVGDNCYLMATSHVAHDCVLGKGVVLGNSANIGGHTKIEDYTFLSLNSSIHQFSKIGPFCLVAANAFFKGFSPPGLIWAGVPSSPIKVNERNLLKNVLNHKKREIILNDANKFIDSYKKKIK